MRHQEGEFAAYAGARLYYQAWRGSAAPLARLILVHGLSEHSGRYLNLVNALLPAGVDVYAFDHRGHGRSAQKLVAHVNDWTEYREDVRAFVKLVAAEQPDVPVFLFGHSMGGLVAANYALHHPQGLRGVLLSAPPLGELGISPALRLLGRVVSWVRPQTVFSSRLDVNGISRDPEVVSAYIADPFIHGRVTAQWGIEFFKALEWTHSNAADFEPPLLIMHGDADRLVPIEASRTFFNNVKQPDKRYISYAGGYHENLSDLHYLQVLADLERWLLERL